MEFETLKEFIEMGGHGPYVWSAYLIAIVTVLMSIVWPLKHKKKIEADIRRFYLRQNNTQKESE